MNADRDWLQEQYHVEVKGDHAYVLSAQGGFSLKVFSHGQCTTDQMVEFAEPIAEFLTALCDLQAAEGRRMYEQDAVTPEEQAIINLGASIANQIEVDES